MGNINFSNMKSRMLKKKDPPSMLSNYEEDEDDNGQSLPSRLIDADLIDKNEEKIMGTEVEAI
jgi:hypothetical protein